MATTNPLFGRNWASVPSPGEYIEFLLYLLLLEST